MSSREEVRKNDHPFGVGEVITIKRRFRAFLCRLVSIQWK
jgi:hypothetical protein